MNTFSNIHKKTKCGSNKNRLHAVLSYIKINMYDIEHGPTIIVFEI